MSGIEAAAAVGGGYMGGRLLENKQQQEEEEEEVNRTVGSSPSLLAQVVGRMRATREGVQPRPSCVLFHASSTHSSNYL